MLEQRSNIFIPTELEAHTTECYYEDTQWATNITFLMNW